jgi:hypothetical protein
MELAAVKLTAAAVKIDGRAAVEIDGRAAVKLTAGN